ncbi:MAG TPA: tetratricopeptide repeat protein [Leadbetterella sp.]|nr:tetratricopeptide repeat protein [Leadbetterella sp.]
MKFATLIALFLFLGHTSSFAKYQHNAVEKLLVGIPKDANYLRLSIRYVWWLVHKLDNPKKADVILDQSEKIALKINDYQSLVDIYLLEALLRSRVSRFDEMFSYLRKAGKVITENKLPVRSQQKYFGLMSNYYWLKFDHANATKFAQMATKLTEKYHLTDGITTAYLTLAAENVDVEAKDKKRLYDKMLQAAYLDSDYTQRYLAENYMAAFYLQTKQLDNALKHAKESLKWVEKYGRRASFSMAWILLADVYLEMNQPKLAKEYIYKSLKMSEKIEDLNRMADSYTLLGYFHFYIEKDTEKAINYYLKAYEIAKKNGNATGEYGAYESLATIYADAKKYEKAFWYQQKAIALKDSVFSKDWALKMNKLELEKKESSLNLMAIKNKNTVLQRNLVISAIGFIVIMSLGGFYILNSRNKFRRLQEQQNLRNRLSADLHDEIGSSLSSISILSEMLAIQPKTGSNPEVMQQISNDARKVIEKMDEIIWTINPNNDEFLNLEARLKSYAVPLLESKGIDFNFDFSGDLENRNIEMEKRKDIYLILKEALNNAIKYSDCTHLEVKGILENEKIKLTVADNGKGFDQNVITQRNGLKNMKHRAESLGAKFEIKSKMDEGTIIFLKL